MAMIVENITFLVTNMSDSLWFYRDVLGMEIIYGAEMNVSLRSVPKTSKTRFLNRAGQSRSSLGSDDFLRGDVMHSGHIAGKGISSRDSPRYFMGRTIF